MAKKSECGIEVMPYTPPDPTSEFRSGSSLNEGISGQKEISTECCAEEASRGRIVKPRSDTLNDEGSPDGGLW